MAVDGKERKGAKAGGNKKVHLLAAVTHTPGIVIAQDKVAKSGKANEITHFRPLLAPLPLDGAVVTSDAMQANRDNAAISPHDQERALPVAHRACFTLLLLSVMACQRVQPGRIRPGYGALCGVRG